MVFKINVSQIFENLFYIFFGIFLAFITQKILSIALGTDLPAVAVASSSMIHDEKINQTFYFWLIERFNYSYNEIKKWPVKRGFGIGDVLIIKREEEYKVGDVIVFDTQGCEIAPIVHRIIKINEDGTYQTKGDHNTYQIVKKMHGKICYDERSIEKNKIYGKVIFIIPKIGYLRVLLSYIIGG